MGVEVSAWLYVLVLVSTFSLASTVGSSVFAHIRASGKGSIVRLVKSFSGFDFRFCRMPCFILLNLITLPGQEMYKCFKNKKNGLKKVCFEICTSLFQTL